MRRSTLVLGSAALLFAGTAGTAHHSTAMFEWGKEVPMANATVERWEWTNPHTFLYVKVTNAKGQTEQWAFEGMSPNHLSRAGWNARTLKPGDKISLTYYKLKDDRKGGFNVSVTFPDGRKMRQLDFSSISPDSPN